MPETRNTSKQETKLLYCYAHEDKALRDELQVHLSGLRRQYKLSNWYDREILPGEEWEEAIDKHLSTADIILLLISAHFVNSDYCYGKEMQHALVRHHNRNCCVIPILLRPTFWEDTPLGKLQMLPTNAKPVTSWPNRDEAFHDVATGIGLAVKVMLAARSQTSSPGPESDREPFAPTPLLPGLSMFIVDKDLKKLIDQGELQIIVDNESPPFNPLEQIGASTIDLRLSRVFRKYKPEVNIIDFTQVEETEIIELPLDGELIIQPGEFILGLTVEKIQLPTNISGFIAARSTIARLGLSVVEQPLIHPGYTGSVALQLKNNRDRPIRIKPLMYICQVMFFQGTGHAVNPYGSNDTGKYFNETGVPRAPQIEVELDKNKQTEDIPIDFAFVTALPKERDAVLKHLGSYKKVQFGDDPSTYYRGRINIPETDEYYEVVVIMLLGMGTGEAAFGAMTVIGRWQPKNIIMVGIAAGVSSKVALGDIVVADYVFYYELAKRTSKGENRRGQYFSSDRLLYDRALSFEVDDWKSKISTEPPDTLHEGKDFPRVHFGAIASGDEIRADARTLRELLNERPDLRAVAMEGAGVARAASHQPHPIRFLEVRSICDYGTDQKNDDWQAFAAETAAAFTISFLRSRPVPPQIGEGK